MARVIAHVTWHAANILQIGSRTYVRWCCLSVGVIEKSKYVPTKCWCQSSGGILSLDSILVYNAISRTLFDPAPHTLRVASIIHLIQAIFAGIGLSLGTKLFSRHGLVHTTLWTGIERASMPISRDTLCKDVPARYSPGYQTPTSGFKQLNPRGA